MADRNQLANEKKVLVDEATVIETNAKSQIEAIQKEILDEVDAQAGIVKE